MMTSLPQQHSPYPGGIQQHPGVPQGHPMAGVPHNPGQQMQGQMNPQMHMGVSGPGGPQVSQAGALMGGMPPGAGGPSAHALQHLNPQAQQTQLYQQQMFANPQLQQMQQHQMIQQHRQQQAARQALMAQQYSGAMPGVGMPNGMNLTQAQYAAMRSGAPMARPVNLPQHLQQAQQQAQHSLEQQQAQQQQQHQQHLLQQMALQQQAQQQAQGGNNQGQQQMNPQQIQNMQAQMAAQQQHAQAQAAAAQAAAQQQNQAQSQPQPQPQQSQPNPQAQQQPQAQVQQQPPNMQQQQQQQAAAMAAMSQQQQRQGEKLKGQCLMRLMQFGDHLSSFGVSSKPLTHYMASGAQRQAAQATKQRDDLNYWLRFVDQFFSSKGILRHSVYMDNDNSNKQYEIPFHALARYFHTHFESGIKNMQMIMSNGSEKELPNNGHFIESLKSSFVYWFENGRQLIASGTLRAHFDGEQKIELFEFVTSNHEEYLPVKKVVEAARPLHEWNKEWKNVNSLPDGKQSPEMNKKKQKQMKSPQQPPPEIDLPPTKVKQSMGITPSVFRFLELAEVIGQMNPLFSYAHQNVNLTPYAALDQYVATQTANGTNPNGQQNPSGPRTPGMSNFPLGASPAAAHLQLPDGSPHVSGSPAQAPGMQLQQSQHGTSSSGPSANTSPNASNKRRRPSAVKAEEENHVNGGQTKSTVKPSPRIGGKRQKGNPA